MTSPTSKVSLASGLLGAAGLIAIAAYTAFTGSPERADQISGAIAGVVLCLGLLGYSLQGTGKPGQSIDQLRNSIRDEVSAVWQAAATARGLQASRMMLLNVAKVDGGRVPDTLLGRISSRLVRPKSLSFTEFCESITQIVLAAESPHIIISGDAGSGKSTVAMSLTIGILDKDALAIPLLVPIGSWQPSLESFTSWLDAQVTRSYESTAAIASSGLSSRTQKLISDRSTLLILDGLDQLSDREVDAAFVQMGKYLAGARVVILTRPHLSARLAVRMPDAMQLKMVAPTRDKVAQYLRNYAARASTTDLWNPVLHNIELSAETRCAKFFITPLRISLAWRLVRSGRVTPQWLLDTISSASSTAEAERVIFEQYVIDSLTHLKYPRDRTVAARSCIYLAANMARRRTYLLAWWRIIEHVPASIVALVATCAIVPLYLACISLPPGLTRGFATGLTTAIILSFMRGIRRSRAAVVVAGTTSLIGVLLVGLQAVGWQRALVDSTEIATAITIIQWQRAELLKAGIPRVVGTVAGTGILSGILAGLVVPHLLNLEATPTWYGITISITLGVGCAVVSYRLLLANRTMQQPSSIRFQRASRGSAIPSFASAFTVSMSIGIAAGVAGFGSTLDIRYGVTIAAVFSIVLGVPIGIAAGLLKWLSTPGVRTTQVTPASSLRTDRLVALGTLALVGGLSFISYEFLLGSMQILLRDLQVYYDPQLTHLDGLIFGILIGVVIACFYSAWPPYLVSYIYLACIARFPPRLPLFLDSLQDVNILSREGSLIRFYHDGLQDYLGSNSCSLDRLSREPGSAWAQPGSTVPGRVDR